MDTLCQLAHCQHNNSVYCIHTVRVVQVACMVQIRSTGKPETHLVFSKLSCKIFHITLKTSI